MASGNDIGIRVGIEGESELRNQLNRLATTTKTLGTEMSKVAAQMANSKTKEDSLRQSVSLLNQQMDKQKQKVDAQQTAWQKASDKAEELRKEYERVKNSSDSTTKEVEKAKRAYLTAAENADKYKQSLNRNETALAKMETELRQVNVELAKTSLAESRFGRLNTAFGKVQPTLNTVANGFVRITKAAAALATGLALISIRRAFSKLEVIEEVRATFEALGKSADQVNSIMTAVQNSVLGTKYAMQDMATVAKGADVSIGKYGLSMEDYLSRVADIAAFTGKEVSVIGSMFNKAAARNKVDSRMLIQFVNAGLPIYDDLAKAMNTTTEAINDMVKEGKVGFEDLYRATARYDDLATKLGMTTIKGAGTILAQTWGNVGVAFLEGLYEPMRDGLTNIVLWLKGNMDTIKAWGASFGEAVKYLIDVARGLNGEVSSLSPTAQKIVNVLEPFVKMISSLVKGFINMSDGAKKAVIAFALLTGPTLRLTSGIMTLHQNIYKMVERMKIAKAEAKGTATAVGGLQTATGGASKGTKNLASLIARMGGAAQVAGVAFAGLLVAMGLYATIKTAGKSYYGMVNEDLKSATQSAKNAAESFKELAAAREQSISTGVGELEYYGALKGELDTIIDANGRVKEGYETRAEYIIGKLNEELNAGITYANGVTNYNQQIRDSIQEVIDRKEAEIVLAAYEEEMTEKLKAKAEAEEAYRKSVGEVSRLEREIQQMEEQGIYDVEAYEQLNIQLAETKTALEDNKKTINDINDSMEVFNKIQEAYAKGNYDEAMAYAEGIKLTADALTQYTLPELQDMRAKELATAEQAKADYEATGIEIYKTLEENSRKNVDAIDTQISDIATTINQGQPKVKVSAENLMKSGAKGLKSVDFSSAGIGVVQGINAGLNNSGAQSGLFSSIQNLGTNLLERFKRNLGIKSPSRVFAEAAVDINRGLALGLERSEGIAIMAVRQLGQGLTEEAVKTMSSIDSKMANQLTAAMTATEGIVANASTSFTAQMDYERLAAAMAGQSIYLDGRLVGRAARGSGVVFV